jgi:hypothetical protein
LPTSFLLFSISTLFNLFFGYFIYLNSKLKISDEEILNLEEKTIHEYYSEYIKNKNEREKFTTE